MCLIAMTMYMRDHGEREVCNQGVTPGLFFRPEKDCSDDPVQISAESNLMWSDGRRVAGVCP